MKGEQAPWFVPAEPELDRDRKVTLSVGQLTDALAEALKVVSDADAPRWKAGDRALVEVQVTGEQRGYTNFVDRKSVV